MSDAQGTGTTAPTAPPGDTGNGFLVNVDPAQQVPPAQPVPPVQQAPAAPAPQQAPSTNGRTYTEDDLEAARREEKDKLYGRIETMDSQLKQIAKEREVVEAAKRDEIEAAAEALRLKEESEMEVRDLLVRKEAEWQQRHDELESRYEQDRAVFERERRFQEVEAYRQAMLEQHGEYIIPELRDLVKGNSETEVDESIEEMKARTAAIMGQLEVVSQQQRQGMRGAAPTAPPVGPMEQMESYESLTPQDIATMDMETYKKYRGGLLDATGRQYRGG